MNAELSKNSARWLFAVRLSIGWLMFYAGITKVLDPAWSAAGYLMSAKTFSVFYVWLSQSSLLPYVNFLNKWSLTLLGISLLFGFGVRVSSVLGALLMLLYYLPVLEFPYVAHGFLVDEHVIYISVLLFFASVRAGRYYGLDNWCVQLPMCRRYPWLHKIWG